MRTTLINREEIEAGAVQRMVANADPDLVPLTDEERKRSLDAVLAEHAPGADLWVFGYGSLLWNPAIAVADTRRARVHGFHRRLCLITRVARGTPERPGLLLGLDRGGSCDGMALRVPADRVVEELGILWRREMVDDAYRPRWVQAKSAEGTLRGIAFVMNRGHRRYAPPMSPRETASIVVAAAGQLGTCRDYLHRTVEQLARLGIRDRQLFHIAKLVQSLEAA
ncbi:gamma-glutamylcyclotransferase [Sorangium sp. So ce1667]